MFRLLALLTLALVATGARAQFQMTPQIIAVAPGAHSQELTIALSPTANMAGAQIDMTMQLDRFGWVQATAAPATAGVEKTCTVVNGTVRALVIAATSMPTGYSIPVCRVRIRPHLVTPLGNYYTSAANGTVVRVDGSSAAASGSSIRVIVDD